MLDTSPKSRTSIVNYEFVKFQRPLFKWFFILLVFVLCLYTVWTIIYADTYSQPIEVALTVVPLIMAIGCASRCAKFRFTEFFIMIICLVVYSLYFETEYETVKSNRDLSFGYLIAFFERMVLERLPMFSHKVMFAGFAIIVRSLFMGVTDIYDSLIRVTLLVFGFILDYTKESKEKELYSLYYYSKESFDCAKAMLNLYVTDNVLIVSQDLKDTLFTNGILEKTFAFSTFTIKDFLQNFELQKSELSRAATGFVRSKDKVKPEIDPEKVEIEEDSQKQEESGISESQNNWGTIAQITLYNYLETLLKTKEAFEEPFGYIFNYSTMKQDEFAKKMKVKVTPSYWEGKPCLCIVINDLTEHFAFRDHKKEDKNKEKVLATISHELRTPLNGILGIVQIMEKEILQPRFTRYLKTCKNSAKLLLSLVNSILDQAQLKNNKLHLTPGTHRIKDILDDVTSLFDFQCQAKQLYLQVDIANGLPKTIYTDRDRLTQVLNNLIGNALKFTFSGGITISVERDIIDPSGLRFSVSDTGVGIEDKDKSRLLKMYGKLEGTAQINPQGIGLGLNISNTLAYLLNENDEDSGIKIESEFQKGSTFSFLIKERLYSNGIIDPQELDIVSSKTYKPKKAKDYLRKDIQTLHVDTSRIRTLEFERKDSYAITIETTEGNVELLPKLNRNLKTLNNSSQVTQETPRQTPRQTPRHTAKTLNSNTRELYSTMGNLDQTYASPREHLLSLGNQPFSPGKSRFLSIDNSPQILIIDDNPFNLMIARELIEAQGIYVHTALNGELGIEQVIRRNQEKQPYKLILMDCEMPVMDGFQASKALVKKMAKGEIYNVPIVAVTANSIDTVKSECIEAGMVDCLSKPLLEDDLKALIAKYLKDTPRSSRAALKKYT